MSKDYSLLSEIADVFKGKAVPAKAETGDIAVINLIDMTPLGISYERLRTFSANPKTISRYLLETGDVLVASKGTQHKVAVFEKQDFPVVASANITVLRPREHYNGYYLKFFLDSEDGRRQLKEADHGNAVMNINTKVLAGIKIPNIPPVKQSYMAQRYLQGLADYKRKLVRANQEWNKIQADIEHQLFS
ncbi:restriction endonuclease subunit S [Streptococcus sciuri]|uniref:Restriction endonuclease subunit S n=1 Tax=Streptococcus sciuri TaxID=2973939 RepID=A0ABT2F5C3_9STRE|nr:restriction endonuclease subunit S [Streptococcus sciuri]MCS4487675.1 restriction endonuclease subunit S [Streptococcus sciuri]